MLRLRPTRVGIDSRDMDWHDKRHQHRQKLRNNGQSVDVFGSPVKSQAVIAANQMLPYHFQQPSLTDKVASTTNPSYDENLISEEPIPRGRAGKIFWNQVVEDAGTPSGILIQNINKQPQIIDRAKMLENNIHSSTASIDENDIGDDPDNSAQLRSRFSSSSGTPYQIGSSERGLDEEANLAEQSTMPIRLAQNRWDDNMHDDASGPISLTEASYQHHGYPTFDGASEQDLDQEHAGMYDSDGYVNTETNSVVMPYVRSEQEVHQSSSPERGTELDRILSQGTGLVIPSYTRSELAFYYLSSPEETARFSASREAMREGIDQVLSQDVVNYRSTGLPRSSLHISQVAASSSPEKLSQTLSQSAREAGSPISAEKHLRSRSPSNEAIDETFGQLLQPLHRRTRFSPPTESLSQDRGMSFPAVFTSEAMNNYHSGSTYIPTRSAGEPAAMIATSSLDPGSSYSYPILVQDDDSQTKMSSPNSSASAQRGRTTRSLFQGSAARRTRRTHRTRRIFRPSPSLSPPHHLRRSSPPSPRFSLRRRTGRIRLPSPSPTPYPRSSATPSPPPSPPSSPPPLPNIHSPRRVRLPVYNDNLPASAQPQTPANIRRSRRYLPSIPYGPRVAYTAPAGRDRDIWMPTFRQYPTTPTRVSWGQRARRRDQENRGRGDELERLYERMQRGFWRG